MVYLAAVLQASNVEQLTLLLDEERSQVQVALEQKDKDEAKWKDAAAEMQQSFQRELLELQQQHAMEMAKVKAEQVTGERQGLSGDLFCTVSADDVGECNVYFCTIT